MKHSIFLLLCLPFFSACFSPQQYMGKGDYHSAVKAYGLVLADQPPNRNKKSDLEGLELAFKLAQQKDSAELTTGRTKPRVQLATDKCHSQGYTGTATLPGRPAVAEK